MICPFCAEPVHPANERHGHCNASRCAGYADGLDDGAWRALLERDVAEVERAIEWFATLGRGADAIAGGYEAMRTWERRVADCAAWLIRARAALGGA